MEAVVVVAMAAAVVAVISVAEVTLAAEFVQADFPVVAVQQLRHDQGLALRVKVLGAARLHNRAAVLMAAELP